MKKEDEIRKALKLISDNKLTAVQKKFISDDISLDSLIERQFNSFFVSYTRSLNILYKKKGHLFDSPFKRILIENETHLSHLIVYIHANAVKHKLVKCIADYSWSSYSSIISDKPTKLSRQEVFHLFGGKDRFIETHLMQTEYYYKFEE